MLFKILLKYKRKTSILPFLGTYSWHSVGSDEKFWRWILAMVAYNTDAHNAMHAMLLTVCLKVAKKVSLNILYNNKKKSGKISELLRQIFSKFIFIYCY